MNEPTIEGPASAQGAGAQGAAASTPAEPRRPASLPLRMRPLVPFSIVGLFVIAVGATLYFASELFLPIFFAVFLSVILRPFVRILKRIGLPDPVGGLVVIIVLVAVTSVAAVQLSQPAAQWIDNAPQVLTKFERKFLNIRRSIEDAQQATEKIEKMAKADKAGVTEVVVRGPSLITQLANYTWLTFAQIIITLALLYVLLAQGGSAARDVIRRLRFRRYRAAVIEFSEAVEEKFSTYVRTLTLINFCVGCATSLAMLAVGMPNPVLWGVLAALLGFLPYLGPFIMMVVLGFAGLATFEEWYLMLAPMLAFMAINMIEAYGITPVVLGRTMTLSPINVFVSMLFWTWAWGMPGALLSVPIAAFIKLVYDHAVLLQAETQVQSAAPAEPPAT